MIKLEKNCIVYPTDTTRVVLGRTTPSVLITHRISRENHSIVLSISDARDLAMFILDNTTNENT